MPIELCISLSRLRQLHDYRQVREITATTGPLSQPLGQLSADTPLPALMAKMAIAAWRKNVPLYRWYYIIFEMQLLPPPRIGLSNYYVPLVTFADISARDMHFHYRFSRCCAHVQCSPMQPHKPEKLPLPSIRRRTRRFLSLTSKSFTESWCWLLIYFDRGRVRKKEDIFSPISHSVLYSFSSNYLLFMALSYHRKYQWRSSYCFLFLPQRSAIAASLSYARFDWHIFGTIIEGTPLY